MEYYHNSLDKPEISSPYTLKNIGILTATFIYFLADSSLPEAELLGELVYQKMAREKITKFKLDKVFDSISGLVTKEEKEGLKKYLGNLKKTIQVSQENKESLEGNLNREAEEIIPERMFKGLVGFDDLSQLEFFHFKEMIEENPFWISPTWLNEVLFLSDSKRNLLQIKKILSGEGLKVDLKKLIAYCTFLKEKGKIKWLKQTKN